LTSLKPKWRSLFVVAILLIAVALVFAACGTKKTATTTTGGTPVAGGTFNYPLTAEPVAIDPVVAYESEGMQVVHQVFQGLVKYQLNSKGEMQLTPSIASSWDHNADFTVWTFHLKHGVMFAPPVSREVKAQDFVDSWNFAADPAQGSYVAYIFDAIKGFDPNTAYAVKGGFTGLKVIDDYTLEITLRYQFAEFPVTVGHPVASVMPMDYVNKIGWKKYREAPVGTGPYVVTKWNHKQSVELAKNASYWDKANAGYVDNIHMPIITSTSTVWLTFQKGELDYSYAPDGQIKKIANDPKAADGTWIVKKTPELGVYFVGVNMKDPVIGGDPNNIQSDPNWTKRQALYWSTDAASVINFINEGVGVPATGMVPEGIPGWRANQSPYGYDPAKAKALIAAMPGGKFPTLQYWYNTDEGHKKIAEALQSGWKSVGINVVLSNYDWSTFLDKLSKGNQGDQIFRMGWLADYPSMDNFLWPQFEGHQPGGNNSSFYNSTAFNDLLTKARTTADDAQRWNLYAEAEKTLLTDIPAIPLYYYQQFRIYSPRVQGQVLDPMGFMDMWKVWVAK
jgi:oligopeptide transport system substrate-binding protein